jgi:hypothetical protein
MLHFEVTFVSGNKTVMDVPRGPERRYIYKLSSFNYYAQGSPFFTKHAFNKSIRLSYYVKNSADCY